MFIMRFSGALLKEKALLLFLLRIPRDGHTHTHAHVRAKLQSLFVAMHMVLKKKAICDHPGMDPRQLFPKMKEGKHFILLLSIFLQLEEIL